MPIPRLRIDQAALLVIDVQDRLLPTIVDRQRIIANCEVLLRAAGELEIPYLVTEQYPKGLGRTVDALASAMADQSRRVEKTRFSAVVDVVDEHLRAWNRPSVLICGLEAHVCVLQTALDLQATGRQTFVCSDAISASQRDQMGPAFDRMRCAGAVVTGVMSALYELMGDATHPSFKAILQVVKNIEQ